MLKALILLSLLTAARGVAEPTPATLAEFLTRYSEVILHAAPGAESAEPDDVALDFWKHAGSEAQKIEAVEYLRKRGLLSDIAGGRVFFLRLLTDEELAEMFHFKMEVSDPAIRESLDSRFFRFALIRLVGVDAQGLVDREPLGLEAEPPLSVEAFRRRVVALLHDGDAGEESEAPMDHPAVVADPAEP